MPEIFACGKKEVKPGDNEPSMCVLPSSWRVTCPRLRFLRRSLNLCCKTSYSVDSADTHPRTLDISIHSVHNRKSKRRIRDSGAILASDERAPRAPERSRTMSTKKSAADGTKKTAALTRRQGQQVKEWRAVATATAANAANLPGVAVQLAALLAVIDE